MKARWLAEREHFAGLPKPPSTFVVAYDKWRRWYAVGIGKVYVGDKYNAEELAKELALAAEKAAKKAAEKAAEKAAVAAKVAAAKEQFDVLAELKKMDKDARAKVLADLKEWEEAGVKEAGAKAEAGAKEEEERKGKAGKGGRRNLPRGQALDGHPEGELLAHCLREGNFQ